MKKIILILSLLALPIVAYAANTGWNPKPDGVHAVRPVIAEDSLEVAGSVIFSGDTTIFSNYSAINNKYMVFANASTAPLTIYLNSVSILKDGLEQRFYKDDTSSNIVTIDPAGSETIGGGTTISLLTNQQSITLKNNGLEWKPIQRGSTGQASTAVKSYNIGATGSGIQYVAGYYHGDSADVNLTQASATATHGSANEPAGAHAFWVFGAMAASGGSGAPRIEVSGTSFISADGGTRTATDSEIIVADLSTGTLDQYYESTKKWLGQVTYTIICDGACTHTTFSADGNIGHAKYDDLGSSGRLGFTIEDFEIIGFAGANDTGFDLELIKHDGTGWTYAATGFVPGNGSVASLSTSYGPENDLTTGLHFSYEIEDINEFIDVNSSTQKEGYLIRITTTSNNAIKFATANIGSRLP